MKKIIHGDSLTVLRSMEPESVHAIITDPPYGIDYQSGYSAKRRMEKIQNDKAPFIWWLYDAYRILQDGGAMICFTRWDVQQVFIDAMRLAGFTVKSEVIWDKMAHGMGDLKAQFSPSHENIIFAVKGKYSFPGKRPNDIVPYRKIPGNRLLHPNEKPVGLMEQLICSVTQPEEIVFDPFMGSGPTIIAAERTGRQYIGIDIEDRNCELTKRRITEAVKGNEQR